MGTLLTLRLVIIAAVAQSATAAAAPRTTVTRQMLRPHSQQPALVVGKLTPPSARAPIAIATAYLESRPAVLAGVDPSTLTFERAQPMKRGHLVRFSQRHRSLEVVGGETLVRIDDAGRVRWVSSQARPLPRDLDTTAKLAPRAALTRLGARSGFTPSNLARVDASRAARLVIYAGPAMTRPRLAYLVELPTDPLRLQKIRGVVDAENGFIYRRENQVKHADAGVPIPSCPSEDLLAYVFDINPTETAELSCVSLANELDAEATQLVNADVTLQNCVDESTCAFLSIPGFGDAWVHFCELVPTATINGDGDFTDYFFTTDTEAEDPFAEVQMFYHVNKVYAVARSLGSFTNLDERPLTAMVNVRIPPLDLTSLLECNEAVYTGTGELQPFDNAAFMPKDALMAGFPATDSIVFGQGTTADFAYDGDVIYHEFGHAVMYTVAPQLSAGFLDQYGLNTTPGGMHEGYADLMTMFVTDDPEIGEYAGAGLGDPGAEAIRDIDNTDTCPNSLIGESHIDSLPLTGAFWEAREAVADTPEKKTTFDEAVFAVQETFTTFDDFQTAAAKTVAEIEIAFDSTVADTVEAIFASRGLDGCNNRVIVGTSKDKLFVGGTDQVEGPAMVPGPVQFEYELSEDAINFKINFPASAAGGLTSLTGTPDPPSLDLVVKGGGDPVLWTVEGTTISGDYTHAAALSIDTDSSGIGSATITGSFPAGTYHLQLVNKGATWQFRDIALTHTAGDISPDAGPSPDAGNPDDGDGGDCGCVVAARDHASGARWGGGLLFLGFVGFGLALLRRRRD